MKSIIILLLDALRIDCINAKTIPNVTNIANDGLVYTNCLSGNTTTIKSLPIMLCSKTKYLPEYSIMTKLRKRGYKSILINTNPLVTRHFSKGWDDVINIDNPQFKTIYKIKKIVPNFLFPFFRWAYRKLSNDNIELPYTRSNIMLKITKEVISVLDPNKPFFLWVHLMDAHQPYSPKISFLSDKELIKLNGRIMDTHRGLYSPSKDEVKIWKELYQKEVSEMDQEIGKFHKSIDWTDKILLITSDHGEEFGENGGFTHQADKFIPELQHVPFILSGLGKGIVKENFSHYDLPSFIEKILKKD